MTKRKNDQLSHVLMTHSVMDTSGISNLDCPSYNCSSTLSVCKGATEEWPEFVVGGRKKQGEKGPGRGIYADVSPMKLWRLKWTLLSRSSAGLEGKHLLS